MENFLNLALIMPESPLLDHFFTGKMSPRQVAYLHGASRCEVHTHTHTHTHWSFMQLQHPVYSFSYTPPLDRFAYYFQYNFDDDFETLYKTLEDDPINQAKVARLGPSLGSGNVRVAIRVR